MKSCRTCGACRRLYRQYYTFYPDRLYCCTVHYELTTPQNYCGDWRRAEKEYDLSPARFDSAEQDILRLIQLLSDQR